MDQLRVCMEALRVLAKEPEALVSRAITAERRISEYLQAALASPALSLENLRAEIDGEIERSRAERNTRQSQFWITVQEFVCSRLPVN